MTEKPPAKKAKLGNLSSNVRSCSSSSEEDSWTKLENDRLQTAASITDFKLNKKRVRLLTKTENVSEDTKGIVYWMSRDVRVQDNWAMLFAQKLAIKNKVGLHVCFCLVPKFLDATIRHFKFLLGGLREVETELKTLDIQFHLLLGEAPSVLPSFVKQQSIGAVVCDFSPLRVPRSWVESVQKNLPPDIPFCQVDAHNIVPVWEASNKLEYAARTIRGKITKQLPEFLTQFPPVINHPYPVEIKAEPVDWEEAERSLKVDMTVDEVKWAKPGTRAGLEVLQSFISKRLRLFGSKRNDPTVNALSNLSPWFHFGQISVQRCILEVKHHRSKFAESVDSFVEEAVVRKELADNFCFYNPHYDSLEGTNDWARKTLNDHKKDKRSYIYSRSQLEEAKTHDDLWNAAQIQLVKEGKMHGFLRMYWAKKILEWTESPEVALADAIYLNDRYNLDGRDPNGYVGCMWSVCGIHDQGWAERPIFGKIRYMTYDGCKRKFDVAAFVTRYGGKKHKYEGKK